MSDEDLRAELARLKAENEALKGKATRATSIREARRAACGVRPGAVSVTLAEQWLKLLTWPKTPTFMPRTRAS
jgi:hypothetical protein